jgi:hypothetical protein
MGRMPVIAAPIAAPVVAFSETGESITRSRPNSLSRSCRLVPAYQGFRRPVRSDKHARILPQAVGHAPPESLARSSTLRIGHLDSSPWRIDMPEQIRSHPGRGDSAGKCHGRLNFAPDGGLQRRPVRSSTGPLRSSRRLKRSDGILGHPFIQLAAADARRPPGRQAGPT